MKTDLQICVKKLDLFEKENHKLKQRVKKLEEEKMELELHVADIVHDHKIKVEVNRLKIRTIRKYALDKKVWFHYVVGSIVSLVVVVIAMVAIVRCTR